MKLIIYIYILFFALMVRPSIAKEQKKIVKPAGRIEINGVFNTSQKGQTIYLTIWKNYISYEKRAFTFSKTINAIIEKRKFSFKIDSINSTVYISLSKGRNLAEAVPLMELQLCSPSDNIDIKINRIFGNGKTTLGNQVDTTFDQLEDVTFSGFGAEKYECIRKIKKLEHKLSASQFDDQNSSLKFNEKFENSYHNHLKWINELLTVPKSYEGKISKEILLQIKADIIGKYGSNFFRLSKLEYKYSGKHFAQNEKSNFLSKYKSITKSFDSLSFLPQEIQSKSALYPEMLINKMLFENSLNGISDDYSILKSSHKGSLMQRLVTNYLLNFSDSNKSDSLIEDAMSYVTFQPYHKALIKLKVNQSIGSVVDNFSLPNQEGKLINLSDFKGKLVFIDFWFTGCNACANYYKNIVSKAELTFRNNSEIVFISVSIDTDKKKWLKSIKSGLYTSNNVINVFTSLKGSLHPILNKLNVTSYPHPILIDRTGRIITNDETLLRSKGLSELVNTINKAL